MNKLLYLLLFIIVVFSCSSDSNDDNTNPVYEANPLYLDTNGVTIKAKDWAVIGDQGTIDGINYTIVDKDILLEMII